MTTTQSVQPTSTPTATGPAPKPKRASLPYFAGLDGLRGIGLIFVVTYHAGYNMTVDGAYLAVSMFFTLSGFLITSLLVREMDGTGHIDMKRFYIHRFRRLMPAAYLGVVLVCAFGLFAANLEQLVSLRADLLSAQFYVANWNFIASDQAYAALFDSPSPVLHFWSLAIEEQFYLVYPLLVIVLLRVMKASRQLLGLVVAALWLVSFSLPFIFEMSSDRFYYGTDTRGAEILAGVLLAVVLGGRKLDEPGWSPVVMRSLRWMGMGAFVVTLGLWVGLPREAEFLYHGGFAVYGLLSALLVWGTITPGAMVGRLLGNKFFVELGKISYGVYVFHWPLFLWLNEERLGLNQFWTMWVRFAVTLVLSVASYHFIEMPIRRGKRPFGIANWKAGVIASPLLVGLIFLATAKAPDYAEAQTEVSGPVDESAVTSLGAWEPPPTTLPPSLTPVPDAPTALKPKPSQKPDRPLRVFYVGDSTATSLAGVTKDWGEQTGVFEVLNGAIRGCGIVQGGQVMKLYRDETVFMATNPPSCDNIDSWRQKIAEFQPDLIVVAQSLWDTSDHLLEGDTERRAPGDPIYDQRLHDEYGELFEMLSSANVPMLWLEQPYAKWGEGLLFDDTEPFEADDPARLDILNEIVAAEGSKYELFRVVPYDEFFENWPGGYHDTTLRGDGIHASGVNGGGQIVMGWLGPELLWQYWNTWAEYVNGSSPPP